jgi:hypothetical protein
MAGNEIWTPAQYHAYLAGQDVSPPRVLTLAPEAPEDALRGRLQSLCATTGWLYYHALKSKGSTPGWPDVALVHPDGGPLYLWELKREDEQVSGAQQRWLDALAKVTRVEVAVMRPRDWTMIQETLARR